MRHQIRCCWELFFEIVNDEGFERHGPPFVFANVELGSGRGIDGLVPEVRDGAQYISFERPPVPRHANNINNNHVDVIVTPRIPASTQALIARQIILCIARRFYRTKGQSFMPDAAHGVEWKRVEGSVLAKKM